MSWNGKTAEIKIQDRSSGTGGTKLCGPRWRSLGGVVGKKLDPASGSYVVLVHGSRAPNETAAGYLHRGSHLSLLSSTSSPFDSQVLIPPSGRYDIVSRGRIRW